jgi:hypothetical protein
VLLLGTPLRLIVMQRELTPVLVSDGAMVNLVGTEVARPSLP